MPFDENSDYVLIKPSVILKDVVESLREQFTDDAAVADVTDASPFVQHAKAIIIAPFERATQDLSFLLAQMFLDGVTKNNLDLWAEGFGHTRLQAKQATGTVNVTLKTALSTNDYSNPFLSAGDVIFRDTANNRYTLDEDVNLPVSPSTTTTLSLTVVADQAGSQGNIDADGLSPNVEFGSTQANTRWNAEVDSFTNNAAFTGGSDLETDVEFKARIRAARSARESASEPGLEFALQDANIGVESLDVLVNSEMEGGSQDPEYDPGGTGVASESVDGSTIDAIAFRIPAGTLPRRWYQHVAAVLAANSSLVVDVAIETDASGEPSGTRLDTQFLLEGLTMAAASSQTNGSFPTALVDYYITQGATTPDDDLWLVFYHVSGSGDFDGDTGGSAGDVKRRASGGGWSDDANINRGNVQLIGGIPPKGVRAFVLGASDEDVAEVLFDNVAAGIQTDGTTLFQVTDSQGFTHDIYFERPTEVLVHIELTVEKTSMFPASGGEDLIKDLLITYVGGTLASTGRVVPGEIGVSGELVVRELVAAIMDDDNISGVFDITTLKVDTTDPPTGTTNLQAARGEIFKLLPANIDLTLVDA